MPLTNSGALNVDAGTLIVGGNVTGSDGTVVITGGGAADFQEAFHQNVTFSGAGTLELAQSLTYGGAISDFGVGDVLDLTDLAYSSSEYAVWTQVTTGGSAAGNLQIYNGAGTLEETLNLNGTYSQSDFLLAPDANPSPGTEVLASPQQIDWQGTSGGNWTNTDWSGGAVPNSDDAANINASGTYVVVISSADVAYSLAVNDAGATVAINNGGTLTLSGPLTVAAGTLQLNSGGTISGGTLSSTGGNFEWAGGTLSGVTYDGTLNLSPNNFDVYIANGLTANNLAGTGPGTINLTGYSDTIYFEGNQTFNNATINLGSNSGYYD